VSPFKEPHKLVTVVVHQARVVPGASMEFRGAWTNHPRFGEQFRAVEVIEKKPASAAALEKYLGSGLIKGVGPKIAQKIVRHFGERTLEVFESRIDELLDVPGIAGKKLQHIRSSWQQHQSIRNVMIFLQGCGRLLLFEFPLFRRSLRCDTNSPVCPNARPCRRRPGFRLDGPILRSSPTQSQRRTTSQH
jgi:exodeoxyribonuclease V alpha subunit